MSFKQEFVSSTESNLESYSTVPDGPSGSPSCVLGLEHVWDEGDKFGDSPLGWFAKKCKGIKQECFRLVREYLLSTVLFIGFIGWSLLIPKEKKGRSLLSYFYDYVGRAAKRNLDIIGAAICLVLSMPLFLIIAILIKLDSPGTVIFKQERVGQNRRWKERRKFNVEENANRRNGDRRRVDCFGSAFKVYKFRTMVDNAERMCGPVWAKKDDPRITSVGKILRRTRLDELPQLLNVLKGEMSLVGPRPERYFFIKNLASSVQHYPQRLSVKPGITGLAQVNNGYDSGLDDVKVKIVYDLDYIRNWSILKDLKILAQTIVVMMTGKGAF